MGASAGDDETLLEGRHIRPGPLSAYRPDCPAACVPPCTQLVPRRTVKDQRRPRASWVRLWHAQPRLSPGAAAARVGWHPEAVRHGRQRWAKGECSRHDEPGRGRTRCFAPRARALVQAAACALVADTKPPLRRQSLADVPGRAQPARGQPSRRRPVWRRLATEAIPPWRYTSWIVPRDPQVAEQAGPMLDV